MSNRHPDGQPSNLSGNAAGNTPSRGGAPNSVDSTALTRIGEALRGLRYGSVLAIVQDGIVVQIERTEKTRLDR